MRSHRITPVAVGPQGGSHEQHIIDDSEIILQKAHIGVSADFFTQVVQAAVEVAVIELMITGHIDHMPELVAASLQEVTIPLGLASTLASIGMLMIRLGHGIEAQILGHHDVAAEDQHISAVQVWEIDISKLQMQVTCDGDFHLR